MLFATVVPGAVVAMMMYLMAARSESGRRMGGAVLLGYGRAMKALPAVMAGLWAIVFVVLAIVEPPQASDLPTILGLLALVMALLVPLTLEVRGVRHLVSSTGIQKVTPWSSDFAVPWKDVRSVTWDPGMNWFVVTAPQGKVRLSRLLDGLGDLRQELQANVPAERWERAAPYLPQAAPRATRPAGPGQPAAPDSLRGGPGLGAGAVQPRPGAREGTAGGWSMNGTGIMTLGYRPLPDGTYVMTRWITVLLVPLVPLNSWVVRPEREVVNMDMSSRREFKVVSPAPLLLSDVLRTYGAALATAAVALGPVALVFGTGFFERFRQTDRGLAIPLVFALAIWAVVVVALAQRRVEMIYEVAEHKAGSSRAAR